MIKHSLAAMLALSFAMPTFAQVSNPPRSCSPLPPGDPRAEQVRERNAKIELGDALMQRMARTQEPFTLVMAEDGQYRYGGLSAEDAELLHAYDSAIGAESGMRQIFKPGRYDLILKFDPAGGRFDYELAPTPAVKP